MPTDLVAARNLARSITGASAAASASSSSKAAMKKLAKMALDEPAAFRFATKTLVGPVEAEIKHEIASSGHYVWKNYLGQERVKTALSGPLEPETADALAQLVRDCHRQGIRIKPWGSGHSSSSCARPDDGGAAMTLDHLTVANPENPNEAHVLAHKVSPAAGVDYDGRTLVRVSGGLRVELANETLWKMGLSVPNMGSYDRQSIPGALCTGTHGSSRDTGPMAEFVQSIDMIVAEVVDGALVVKKVRIDSDDEPSHPDSIPPGVELRRGNDLFRSAVISFGTFGIVYAMTLKVEDRFWLTEERTVTDWETAKQDFVQRGNNDEFVDYIVNPNEHDGKHTVLRTNRFRHTTPQPAVPKPGVPVPPIAAEIVGKAPGLANLIFDEGLKRRGGTASGSSYKMFILGAGDIPAKSCEIAMPISNAVAAVDMVIALAKKHGYWHSSPIGVRFVKRSKHFLSFANLDNQPNEPRVCTIEVPLIKTQKNTDKILTRIEVALRKLGGRAHWGQFNHTVKRIAARQWPTHWDTWLGFYRQYNQAGMWSNKFTDQLGLDSEAEFRMTPGNKGFSYLVVRGRTAMVMYKQMEGAVAAQRDGKLLKRKGRQIIAWSRRRSTEYGCEIRFRNKDKHLVQPHLAGTLNKRPTGTAGIVYFSERRTELHVAGDAGIALATYLGLATSSVELSVPDLALGRLKLD